MSFSPDSVADRVFNLIEPILLDLEIELVDVEYLTERGRWVLRVYIDKEGGVTLDDCARVSGEIEHPIEVKEIIDHEYVLEVSSPGLNRPLRKEQDFQKARDNKVKIIMSFPLEGRKRFTGYLRNMDKESLQVEIDGRVFTLPREGIKKANLVYDFDGLQKGE